MRWFIYAVAMGTWALLAYATLLEYLAKGVLFARQLNGHPYVSDFVNLYNAARLGAACLHDRTLQIYDAAVQDAWARPLIAPVVPEQPFYLQYPPDFFALVAPLSAVPMAGAWLIWNGIWLSALIGVVWKLAGTFERRARIACCVFAVACYPVWLSVELGQPALMLFACIAGIYFALKAKRNFLAGLICSLISIKFQYLPTFALIGLLAGRRNFLFGFIAGCLALMAISTAVLGQHNILAFPQSFLQGETSSKVSGVNVFAMQNFRALIEVLTGNSRAAFLVGALCAAIALVGIAGLWLRQTTRGAISDPNAAADPLHLTAAEAKFDWLYSVSILVALIASLHAHVQDYILAIIPCLLLLRIQTKRGNGELELTSAYQNPDRTDGAQRASRWLCIAFPALSWGFFLVESVTAIFHVHLLLYFVWAIAMIYFAFRSSPAADNQE